MEDNQIIDLYLQRDESAIIHTANQYGKRLRNISMGIVAELETAEECENDTYLQAWNSIPPNEPRNYLFAFLVRIIAIFPSIDAGIVNGYAVRDIFRSYQMNYCAVSQEIRTKKVGLIP